VISIFGFFDFEDFAYFEDNADSRKDFVSELSAALKDKKNEPEDTD